MTLDQLRSTLQARLQASGDLLFESTDLGDQSDLFVQIVGAETITIHQAVINEAGSPLTITGTAALWQQPDSTALTFDITQPDTLFEFLLQSTPASDWTFSDSFADLAGSYFDNLPLSNSLLLGSSAAKTLSSPAITLEQGLNYSGEVAIDSGALQSIEGLSPEQGPVRVQGLITQGQKGTEVNLQGSMPQSITLQLEQPLLHLSNIPRQGQDPLATAGLTDELTEENFTYTVGVQLPVTADALDELERLLRERLAANADGVLLFQDTDLGEDNPAIALFASSVWATEISIAGAVISRTSRDLLQIDGTSNVWALGDDQVVGLGITEQSTEGPLDFTLSASPDASSWSMAQTDPQVAFTWIDDISWTSPEFIATSLARNLATANGSIDLQAGLNFAGQTTAASGSLTALQSLAPAYQQFMLLGTLSKTGQDIGLVLTAPGTTAIELAPIGFSRVSIAAPNTLTIDSERVEAEGEAEDFYIHAIYIAGTATMGDLSFPAQLEVPVPGGTAGWELSLVPESLPLDSVSSLFALSTGDNISTYFPPSFDALLHLTINELQGAFLLAGEAPEQQADFGWQVTLADVNGEPQSWSIISNPTLAISHLSFVLQISYIEDLQNPDQPDGTLRCIIGGKVTIGSAVMNITLAVPLQGNWLLEAVQEGSQTPSLTELAQFGFDDPSQTEDAFIDPLPQGLVDEADQNTLPIMLDELQISFDPFQLSLDFLSFQLSQNHDWEVISSVLRVYNWQVAMKLNVTGGNKVSGMLSGNADISGVADIAVLLEVPEDNSRAIFDLRLREGTVIQFQSIAELLGLAQGASTEQQMDIPQGFNGLATITVDILDINLSPANTAAPLNFFNFNSYGAKRWEVIPQFMELNDLRAGLHLQRKGSGNDYETKGFISATVMIQTNAVWLYAGKETFSDPWRFKLAIPQEIELPTLEELATFMLPATMVAYIPWDFMPFPDGFNITRLNISFNLSDMLLEHVDFSLRNRAPWAAIPGYITLDDTIIGAQVTVDQSNTDSSTVTAGISTLLQIGNADLRFQANFQSPAVDGAHWHFSINLENEATLDFADLLSSTNLSDSFLVPVLSWLPTLTIKALTGQMAPETGDFSTSGTVLLTTDDTWSIPFLGLQLNMIGLDADISFRTKTPENPERPNFFKVWLAGQLHFSSLRVSLSLQLGSAGTDTIFTGILSNEQLQDLSITGLADSLVTGQEQGQETDPDSWAALTPADMDPISYGTAAVYYNQGQKQTDNAGETPAEIASQSQLFLYGSLSNLGSAIFLTQQATDQERGYLFGFALNTDFTFATLWPGLAPADGILQISEAGVTVNTYPVASATELVREIDALLGNLQNTDDKITVTNPITRTSLPAGEVVPGMHLYAALNFTSNLFSKFLQLEESGETPDVTLYATLASNSAQTFFEAAFAEFNILQTVFFFKLADDPGIMMRYELGDGESLKSQFSLRGGVGFDAFGTRYNFNGSLVVNEELTHFNVSTPPDEPMPLFPDYLPPLFTLSNLGLDVIYYFQTETNTEKYLDLAVSGQVTIGLPSEGNTTVELVAAFHLLNGVPVLANVVLTQDFTIGDLINQLVGAQSWPSDFFDITFLQNQPAQGATPARRSRMYFYDQSADSTPSKVNAEGEGFINGYHLESTIELTFLTSITLQLGLDIVPENNVGEGQKAGMSAFVELTSPIDIYILSLASQTLMTQEQADALQKENGDLGTGSDGKAIPKYAGGPRFELDTQKDSPSGYLFGFKTGVNFFEYPFGLLDITVENNPLPNNQSETLLRAHIATGFDVPPFGQLAVDFSYSESRGFQVDNWPQFQMIGDFIDLVEEIEEIANAAGEEGVCGALVGLATDVAYTTAFNIRPHFDTRSDGLYFVLTGTYSAYLGGDLLPESLNPDIRIFTITFPDVAFLLPNDLSLDKLPGEIASSITGAATEFVQALINDPSSLAAFLSTILVENAIEIGANLLCKDLIGEGTATAIEAGVGTAIAAVGGEGLADVGLVAVALIGGGALAIGIIAGTGLAIAGSLEATGGGGEHGNSGQDDPPGAPDIRRLVYTIHNDEPALLSTWTFGSRAAGYDYKLTEADGNTIERSLSSSTLSRTENISLAHNGGAYEVKVRSTRGGSLQSDWDRKSIDKLADPEQLQFSYQRSNDTVQLSWQQDDSDAAFEVAFFLEDAQPNSVKTDQSPYQLAADSLPAGVLQAQVQAISSDSGDEVSKVPSQVIIAGNTLLKLNPVASLNSAVTGHTVQLSWQDAQAATTGYQVEAVPATGNTVPFTISNAAQQSLNIDTDQLGAGSWTFRVRPTGATATVPGNYETAPQSITVLALPAVSQEFNVQNDGKLQASITPVEAASAYEINIVLTDREDQQIYTSEVPQPDDLSSPVIVNIGPDDFNNPAGGAMQVQARALAPAGSAASALGTSGTTTPRMPQVLNLQQTANDTNQSITLTWDSLPQAVNGYLSALINQSDADAVIASQTLAQSQEPLSNTFDLSQIENLPSGEFLGRVRVPGDATTMTGGYTDAPEGNRQLAAVTNPRQDFDKQHELINVRWDNTPQEGLTHYQLQIIDLNQPQATPRYNGRIELPEDNRPQIIDSIAVIAFSSMAGGDLQTHIIAAGDAGTLSATTIITGELTELAAPQPVTYAYDDSQNSLQVSWGAVSQVSSYLVTVRDVQARQELASKTLPIADLDPAQPGTTFTETELGGQPLSGVFQCVVQAQGTRNQMDSLNAETDAFVQPPVLVPALTVYFIDDSISVSWEAGDSPIEEQQYELVLSDGEGNPIGEPVTTTETAHQFPLSNPREGDQFQVKMRITSAHFTSPYGPDTPVTVHLLPAPTGLNAGTDGQALFAVWETVSVATAYQIELQDGQGQGLKLLPNLEASPALQPIDDITEGTDLQINIRAQQDNSFSPASAAVDLTFQNSAKATSFLPEAFPEGEILYLANPDTQGWASAFLAPYAVTDAMFQNMTITVGSVSYFRNAWFPVAYSLQSLQGKDWHSGQLVALAGYDAALKLPLIQSSEGANGPFTWTLSTESKLSRATQVFRLMKWESNDGGGDAQFGTGPIADGDTVMLLRYDHESVNPSMDTGPEAMVYRLQLNPDDKVLILPETASIEPGANQEQLQVDVSFGAVVNATSYQLQLMDGQLEVASQTVEGTDPPLSGALDLPQPQSDAGTKYLVRVTALNSPDFRGITATQEQPITVWPQVGELAASYDKDARVVRASWTNRGGVSAYTMQVVEQPELTGLVPQSPGLLDVSTLTEGTFHLQVRAMGDALSFDGNWSEPVAFQVVILTLTEYATELHAAGTDGATAGQELLSRFPDTTEAELAAAMATAGYDAPQTTAGLNAAFPNATSAAFTAAMQAAYPGLSPNDYASQARSDQQDVLTAAAGVHQNFPDITATDFAIALATAGYNQTEVTTALKQEFPDLTPQEFAAAMSAAFGSQSAQDYANQAHAAGTPVTAAASTLVTDFGVADATTLAVTLATAGYDQTEVTTALKQEFPDLTPQEFAAAMSAAFGSQSAQDYANQAHTAGTPVTVAASTLVTDFGVADATTLAVTLATAGYNQTEVTTALKQEFPDLSPQEFAAVMTAAFPPQ